MFLKKRNIIFLVFLGIAIITLLLYQTKKVDVVQIGGAFKLTNHHGESVSTKNFENNFLLVFFGFTNCPDFCPNTLNNISTVMQQLDEKSNDIIPLFITVDPERDTVPVLKKYLTNFHPKIIGLTGTNEEIDLVKKKYKIFSKKVMDKEKKKHNGNHHGDHDHGGYSVNHTTIIYLMDKKGLYITHFSPETSSSEMIEKINQL